jgi:hypothetical protein
MTDLRAVKRPASLYALVLLMGFQGLSGVAGGFGLAADPTGRVVGVPDEWLAGSPFSSYLIPGLVLLTVLGLVPLAIAYGLWSRRTWSLAASVLVGLALLVWLAVEIAVIGYQSRPPLQLVYGVVGTAILLLALRPSVRDHVAAVAETQRRTPPR